MKARHRRHLAEWTNTIVSSAVMFLVMRAVVVEAYDVPTGSRRPTILEHERVLGTKFHYWLWAPERGDVVVFRTPPAVRALQADGGSARLLKRIVAIAGTQRAAYQSSNRDTRGGSKGISSDSGER